VGVQAFYVAKKNPQSFVYGYDNSSGDIATAQSHQQRRGITNIRFLVASHDDFEPPYRMDMIYTADSLIGTNEVQFGGNNIVEDAQNLLTRRLLKFNESLNPSGIYMVTLGSTPRTDSGLVGIAEQCGLKHIRTIEGPAEGIDEHGELGRKVALIFERN